MRILIFGSPTTNGYRCFQQDNVVAGGGWVQNIIGALLQDDEIELYAAYYASFTSEPLFGEYNKVHYCALPERVKALASCSEKMCDDLQKILEWSLPDVVHIIGTEREHDLKLMQLAGAEKTLISITGLVSVYAFHYLAGIDSKQLDKLTVGDMLRRGGPIKEKKKFEQFGAFEKRLLCEAKYVSGRTTWDYACVKQINPNIEYIHCGEILNPIFFDKQWSIQKIQKHRIFLSQGTYPLKGVHMALRAFSILLNQYPDAEMYIAGGNILKDNKPLDCIKRTTYAQYLIDEIEQLKIDKSKIHYIGATDANGMLAQYLKCNVFVLPSAIENSPNSLGEAMVLGVPCVASCVGGVQDMLRDRQDGYLYPFDEPYMLAHYVSTIFDDDNIAVQLGTSAAQYSKERFNAEEVKRVTIESYKHIMENEK